MADFTMPSLGADMDSGKITEWLVEPGDVVHRGDIIAVVDTAKAAIEVEVFTDGTVAELLVEPGVEVPVGTALARIEEAGEQPGGVGQSPGPEADRESSQPGSDEDAEPAGGTAAPASGKSERAQSPADETSTAGEADTSTSGAAADKPVAPTEKWRRSGAPVPPPPLRHLAHQLGVDLDTLAGTGPNGKITRADVVSAGKRLGGDAGGTAESQGAPSTRVPATPLARRLAAEHRIDLTGLTGSGVWGRILAADVRDATAAREAAERNAEQTESAGAGADEPTATSSGRAAAGVGAGRRATARVTATGPDSAGRPGTTDRKQAMRAAIASLMSRSAAEIPHYYVTTTVDLAGPLRWLAEHNRERPAGERVLPVALFLHAVVRAAQQVPDLNGHWVDGGFAPADGVSPGVAIATRDGGLVTPRIVHVERMSVDELMAALADLVRRARRGNLRADELQPGSITLTSLADGGPDALLGVIYPPQVALVGIGAIAERPWAVDGMLTVRPTVTISLAADHRASDGRTGAAFLDALTSALKRPEEP